MGSKRVGLARTEALIENLKRELQLNQATLKGGLRDVRAITANLTLTADDSGAIIVPSGAARTVTLPAPAIGLQYTLIAGSAHQHILQTAGTNIISGFIWDATNANTFAAEAVSGGGILTMSSNADIGDELTVFSDGTSWFLKGFCRDSVVVATH